MLIEPFICSTLSYSCSASHVSMPPSTVVTCVGPSCSRALAIIVTSAPTSRAFSASSAVWIPVVQAKDACTLSRRTPIQRSGSSELLGGGQVQRRIDRHRLEVDVRLHEPVEEHQPVGARGDQPVRHVPDRGEERPIFTASGM